LLAGAKRRPVRAYVSSGGCSIRYLPATTKKEGMQAFVDKRVPNFLHR